MSTKLEAEKFTEFQTRIKRKPVPPDQRGGETFDHNRDAPRRKRQAASVLDLMIDGKWRTRKQIAGETGEPEASVSARLRDLRKDRFGGWQVDREHIARGLWQYRVRRPE